MRLRKPSVASLDQVKIRREGEYAVIEYADSSIATAQIKVGPEISQMSDEEILELHNRLVEIREEAVAEYEHIAVEIPEGRPQIEYHTLSDQWTPRGSVLRCFICDGGLEEGPIFYIDDEELNLREFGRLLSTYAGWGMRIVFVPEHRLKEQLPIEVRDPDDSN